MNASIEFILNLVFFYPFFMSILVTMEGLNFYWEKREHEKEATQCLRDEPPFVSILVPCYNEEQTVIETIEMLEQETTYPNFELILIDDGSKDKTGILLEEALASGNYPHLKVIKIEQNMGKAHALTQGAIAANGELLLVIDADSFLERGSIEKMVTYFDGEQGMKVGAVTGQPIVRNRSTLLAKIQLAEYASIVSLTKRAQSVYGKLNTVSGVCVMFRKQALLDVGWWDQDMITEDISVTWQLQREGWKVKYAPEALCWMLVPETINGLWKQRVRWAQGGLEVLFRHADILISPKNWGLLPLILEQATSLIWCLLWYISLFLFTYDWVVTGSPNHISIALGSLLVVTCLFQFMVSLAVMRQYDRTAFHYIFWAGWYPFFYWLINPLTSIAALPKAIIRTIKGGQAVWNSPDRGITAKEEI